MTAALRRLGDSAIVLLGASVLTFLMLRLAPGDAIQIMLGANSDVTPERVAALRTTLGLDQPFLAQYIRWVGAALHGDLGTSLWTARPVSEEIVARVGVTVELTVLALGVSIVLAVPLGCLMAFFHGRAIDLIVRFGSIVGLTLPSFWLGALMLYGVAELAPQWPVVGYVPFAEDPWGNLQRMILPVAAISLPTLAGLSRILRSSMLDALGQDYVRTARAKGLGDARVVLRHALRNALAPFVASAGITAGYLFGGAVVIEQVFALPGLGRLMIGAITERNYPLLQGAVLLVTLAFILVNLVVDVLHRAIDPRARA